MQDAASGLVMTESGPKLGRNPAAQRAPLSLVATAPLLKASAQDFGKGRQFTIPFSYTALPSVVIPCGLSPDALPIGLQIVGDHFQEALLLRIAAAHETQTKFNSKRPPVFFAG